MFIITSKILNFLSAYLILYPLLIIRVIFLDKPKISLWCENIKPNLILIAVLLFFFMISLIWIFSLLRWKNNTRIKGFAKENITFEMMIFFATYIIPLILIDIQWVGLIVSITIFLVFGIIFIASDKHFLNPTFLLFGYKLYRLNDFCVLYKGSIDSLNISLTENQNGISARELVRNTYIALPK